jgi:hypothetical protein
MQRFSIQERCGQHRLTMGITMSFYGFLDICSKPSGTSKELIISVKQDY